MIRTRPRSSLVLTIVAGVVAVAAGTAVASSPASAPTAATRISGRIVDDRGHPLAGVVVNVESEISFADFHTTRTGRDGRYSIRSTPGPQQLTLDGGRAAGGDAGGTGYVGSRPTVVVARYGRVTSGVDVVMHPGGEVRGSVTDAAGHPLTGVTAWLADVQPYVYTESYDYTEQAAGTEDAVSRNGAFRIGGVRPGAYQLCFDTTSTQVVGGASDRAGYETACGSRVVAVTAGAVTRPVASSLTRSDGGVVFGRVTARNGRPVVGVQVETRVGRTYGDAVTGDDGYYRVQDLPTGSASVCFQTYTVETSIATGFAPGCRSTKLAITTGRSYRVDRTLAPGGALRGTARVTGGAPLAGAIVDGMWGQVYGINDVTTETGDGGHFVLKNLPARAVEVCFSPDFSSAAGPGAPFGAVGGADFCRSSHPRPGHVTSGVDDTFRPAGSISGTVRDQNGRPLSNVQVDLEGNTDYGNEGEFYAYTDRHGRYRGVDLPPGKFEVCFSNLFFYEKCYRAPGATRASAVQVRRGKQVTGVDETLSTAHNDVSVVVVDAAGHRLPGADAVLLRTCHDPAQDDECLAQPPAGARTYTVADSDVTGAGGRVTWPAVDKGSYTACVFGYYATTPTDTPATGHGDVCDPTPVDVAPTGNSTVRIVLPDDGAVTGRVTDSAGKPLSGVRVHIRGSAADDFADSDYDSGTPTPHRDAYTDANGYYTVRSVASGEQTACFDPRYVTGATAYRAQCLGLAPGTTSGGDTVEVTADRTTAGVDIALSAKNKTGSAAACRPGCGTRVDAPAPGPDPHLHRFAPRRREVDCTGCELP